VVAERPKELEMNQVGSLTEAVHEAVANRMRTAAELDALDAELESFGVELKEHAQGTSWRLKHLVADPSATLEGG
jgi:hypothetical protein